MKGIRFHDITSFVWTSRMQGHLLGGLESLEAPVAVYRVFVAAVHVFPTCVSDAHYKVYRRTSHSGS